RQALLDELVHHLGRRGAIGKPDIREWTERTGKIESRGEERLRRIGRRAGDHSDGSPAPALVEKLDGACRTFVFNLYSRNIVANFDGKIELRVRFAFARFETEACFAERQPFQIKSADRAGIVARGDGAKHFDAEHTGRVIGGGECAGRLE